MHISLKPNASSSLQFSQYFISICGINAKNTEKEDAGIKMARIHMHISLNSIYLVKLCPFK